LNGQEAKEVKPRPKTGVTRVGKNARLYSDAHSTSLVAPKKKLHGWIIVEVLF